MHHSQYSWEWIFVLYKRVLSIIYMQRTSTNSVVEYDLYSQPAPYVREPIPCVATKSLGLLKKNWMYISRILAYFTKTMKQISRFARKRDCTLRDRKPVVAARTRSKACRDNCAICVCDSEYCLATCLSSLAPELRILPSLTHSPTQLMTHFSCILLAW